MIYGPITPESINKNGSFSSDIIKGDGLILELFEPNEEKGNSILNLSRIVHGFRNIFQPTNFGDSNLTCQDDVSCNSNWSIQSNGVAMIILSNMERLCSGSLLNNACQDFTPNILTAFHCIDIGNDINNITACSNNEVGNGTLTDQEIANAENWVFRFQYKRPNCNTGSEPSSFYTFQRATFRAGWFNTDFALVEMNQNPINGDPNSGIRYLGWTRAGLAPTSGAILGHPRGDVMKISTFGAAASNTGQITFTLCPNPLRQSISPVNTHWTTSLNDGALEGGSSGGPFFDQNNRVIGQLHGGVIGCAPTTAHAGRFDVSWTGGGNDNNRLSTWLTNDPDVIQTNTISIPTISGSSTICPSGTSYAVTFVPDGYTVSWTCSSNISFDQQTGSPKTFTANGTDAGWIQAMLVSSTCGTVTLPRKDVWNVPPTSNISFTVYRSDGTLAAKVGSTWMMCPNTNYHIYINNSSPVQLSNYNWTTPSGWTKNYTYQNMVSVNTNSSPGGPVTVSAYVSDCNNNYTIATTYFGSGYGCSGYYLLVSPNPSSSETLVELKTDSETTLDENLDWDLDVYDSFQGLKEKKTKLKTAETKINTSDWKDGVYIVRATVGDKVITEKLVVKH